MPEDQQEQKAPNSARSAASDRPLHQFAATGHTALPPEYAPQDPQTPSVKRALRNGKQVANDIPPPKPRKERAAETKMPGTSTQPLQRKFPESDMSLDTLLRLREIMKSRRRTLHSDLRRIKDTIRLKREVQIPDPSLRTSASQRAADSDRGTSTTSTFSLGSQRQAPSQLTRRARNRIAPTAPQRILAQDIALPAM